MSRKKYSYMNEIDLSDWDGERPLVVYDGVCVLCSFFTRWIVRWDKNGAFVFTTAQSPLGQALYSHYKLDGLDFETNLVIIDGQLHEKLHAAMAVCEVVGYPWRLFTWLRFLPSFVLNPIYDVIARNRFRLFGRRDQCEIGAIELRDRLVGFDG